MSFNFTLKAQKSKVLISVVSPEWIPEGSLKKLAEIHGFTGKPGDVLLVPDQEGALEKVYIVITQVKPWEFGKLSGLLPAGEYALDLINEELDPSMLCLAWGMGVYEFGKFKTNPAPKEKNAYLELPESIDTKRLTATLESIFWIRDMVNTPADIMTPLGLSEEALKLKELGATVAITQGRDLLTHNYPSLYTVGKGSDNPPCLIDVTWGNKDHPKITLVGKGVTFDTGGLNIKHDSAMLIMKKDMGGAAHVLGLARMIIALNLPVRLRVMVGAAENSISGSAMRPMDIIKTRKGLTVEIGHTDAEGRLVMADLLTEGARENPALLIDCATLTGAARIALGPNVPGIFTNRPDLGQKLAQSGCAQQDPLWLMPLWQDYGYMIKGKTADLNNDSSTSYGGAITAALFLENFVTKETPWMHIDMMCWNIRSTPSKPEGGEAMGLRALFHFIETHFC